MQRWSDYQLSGSLNVLIREYVVTSALIVFVLVGVASAMAAEINIVAATVQIFGIALISFAMVSPKRGMYLLILCAGYLDFIKRVMVMTGQIDKGDVAWVLAVAPVIFVSVVLGIIGRRIFKHRVIERGESRILALIAVLVAVNLALVYRDTSSAFQTLQWSANTAGYIPLLMVVGLLFPTLVDIKRFLRYVCLILLPVAIYAVWQYFFGLTDFEYAYLKSGLTITEMYLDDVSIRAFSTLASAHPLTVVCAALCLLCLIPVRLNRKSWFLFTNWPWVAASFTFFCGSLASLARAGWLMAAIGLVAVASFGNRTRTKIFYAVSITSFLLVVLNPYWIEAHLGEIQEVLPSGSGTAEMAFRMGTIGDRLHGWKNILANPLAFGPFGIPVSERTEEVYVHDQVGEMLVSVGYVGLTILLCVLVFIVVQTHKLIWKIRDPDARQIAVVCLAIIFATLASGAALGGHTSVFPMNVLFWLAAGVIAQIVRLNEASSAPAKEPQSISGDKITESGLAYVH